MSQAKEPKFFVIELSIGAIDGYHATREEANKMLDGYAKNHSWGHWAVVEIVEDRKPDHSHAYPHFQEVRKVIERRTSERRPTEFDTEAGRALFAEGMRAAWRQVGAGLSLEQQEFLKAYMPRLTNWVIGDHSHRIGNQPPFLDPFRKETIKEREKYSEKRGDREEDLWVSLPF